MTVSVLVAGHRTNELPYHLLRAVENRLTKENLIEVITHLAFHAGWPAANTAISIARDVLTAGDGEAKAAPTTDEMEGRAPARTRRLGDDDYLRRKATLTAEIEDARRPRPLPGSVDPARALAWLEDLRSLWEVELPEAPEHGATRREYELRRAEATASAFDRLEVLGPVIVEAKVADDPPIGRSLVLALAPERARLTGEKAAVMQQLIGGRRSRLIRSDTADGCKKRHQRSPERRYCALVGAPGLKPPAPTSLSRFRGHSRSWSWGRARQSEPSSETLLSHPQVAGPLLKSPGTSGTPGSSGTGPSPSSASQRRPYWSGISPQPK